jgi:hypothetical protein
MKEKIITPKYLYTLGTILHVLEFKLFKKKPLNIYTHSALFYMRWSLNLKKKKEKKKKKEDKY